MVRLEYHLKDFNGLNNAFGNEAVAGNEAVDLNNIKLDPRGALTKGDGAYDQTFGDPASGLASSVLGMRFNSPADNYKAVFGLGTAATFYDYSPTANTWTICGYTDGNSAGITSNTNFVKNAGETVSANWHSQMLTDCLFKFNTWSTWWQITNVQSASGFYLGTTPYTTLSATGQYTIRYPLEQVTFNNYENPTLQSLSYWHSPDESTSYVYKWDEDDAQISKLVDADIPSNPKRVLAFKNRLWISTGVYTADLSWSIESSTYHKYIFDADGSDSGNGTARDLTEVGTPTYTAGKLSNALTLNGTDQYCTHADNADFEIGTGDFTLCGWFYIDTITTLDGLFSKSDTADGNNLFECHFGSTQTITYIGGSPLTASSKPSTGEWVFMWWKRSGAGVSMGWTNATTGTFSTTAKASATNASSVGVNDSIFTLGCLIETGSPTGFFDGKIDQFIFCKGTGYSDAQLTGLYNKGTGTTSTSYSGAAGGIPNRLYYSDLNDYDAWTATTHQFDIPTNTKEQIITCLGAYYDTLVIGTTSEIWLLYGTGGDPLTTWSLKKSNSPIGIKENSPTALVGGWLAFIGYDDFVYAFDGQNSFKVGDKLDINENCTAQSMMSYKSNLYGVFDNAGVYIFDFDKKSWLKSDMGIRTLYTDGVYLYGGSSKDGKTYRLFEGGVGPNSAVLTSFWESKWYDFEKPEENKTFFDAWLYCEPQTHSGTIDVSFYKAYSNTTATPFAEFALSQSANLNPQNGLQMATGINGINARHWKMRISNAGSNEPYQINKIILRADMPDYASSDIRKMSILL